MLKLLTFFLVVCAGGTVPQPTHELVTTTTTARPEEPDSDADSLESQSGVDGAPYIRSLRVTSDVRFRYAVTLVYSRMKNPSDRPAQASFTLTLPDAAFISEFLMDVKGKVYRAHVKEKKKAKYAYDKAVRQGRFAGHVAAGPRDSNQFNVSVNIEAHGKVTFNLTYEQLLPRTLGEYTNVVNINPHQIVSDMSVTVNIEEPSDIINLVVPELQDISNEVSTNLAKKNEWAKVEELSQNHMRVTWAPSAEQQRNRSESGISGQFIVKYDVDREQTPQQILVDDGYFVHFFAPDHLPPLKKHAVFVLDYSGSMSGRKLEQLKDAMNTILAELTPNDYFSIVIFNTYVQAWSPNREYSTRISRGWDSYESSDQDDSVDKAFVIEASPENIRLAQAHMASYSRLGATNIMGGLRMGLRLVKIGEDEWANESDRPQPILVMLTDGQPNVGEYDTNVIVENTKSLNSNRCPIYGLAFGYDADFKFLRKLSISNDGFARKIYEAADASDQLKKFYRTIASPLLRDIKVTYVGEQVDNYTSTTQKEFPVYFKGSEIVVAGKIGEDTEELSFIGELSCTTSAGVKKYNTTVSSLHKPKKTTLNPTGHLEKSWAYLKIKQLLDKADSVDDATERNRTQEDALELALKYSFVTPLTSLVVVKPDDSESSVGTSEVKPSGAKENPSISSPMGGPAIVRGMRLRRPDSLVHNPFMAASRPGPDEGRSALLTGYSPVSRPFLLSRENGESVRMHHHLLSARKGPSKSGSSQQRTTTERLQIEMRKVSWTNVNWLSAGINQKNFTVNIQGNQYNLGINKTDTPFGMCSVNGKDGECHHLQYCALDVFKDDVEKYIPFMCPIPGKFLGVCCPLYFV